MRVPVRLLGFVFWLFFLNCGQCQVCSRDQIPHKNTEPVEKESYNDGETVKLTCTTGFTGMYRIKCVKGEWMTSIAQPCEKKKCTHPGDTPNGDFKLVMGSEFVFGATVVYTCKEGFEMTTRINQRTCRSQGWDNAVPICEAMKCPAIHTDEGATCPLSTTMEDLKINIDGSVKPGQRLRFSCNGQGLKLKGQEEITCQSNGEWSSPFPKCEEVMCVAKLPGSMRSDVTEDGHLGREVSMRPGDTITLSCVGKGTKLQGQSKITCMPSGEWNPPFPKCVGGKCEQPPQVEFADTIEMTKPEYNSMETVEYSCFDKYTLDLDHPYSKYLTCEQGEWRGNIRCLKPCSVTVEELDVRGIQLKWRGREKIFSPHRDRITFACMEGKRLIGSDSTLHQYCNDGVMDLPQCE